MCIICIAIYVYIHMFIKSKSPMCFAYRDQHLCEHLCHDGIQWPFGGRQAPRLLAVVLAKVFGKMFVKSFRKGVQRGIRKGVRDMILEFN